MPKVISEIKQWGQALPFWEQYALDCIIDGKDFTTSSYEELLEYLLEDKELAKKRESRPQLHFIQEPIEDQKSSSAPIRIKKISNLKNVNALVPGQGITFGEHLTAIFGANGSGKSGYARVLGCAGFTRGDKEIIPDVTQPYDESIPPSAEIEVEQSGTSRCLPFTVGAKCQPLESCYVFDSTSVLKHLTEKFTFSFSPAGLSFLAQLAEITDEVRKLLTKRIEECQKPHNFISLFQGTSKITELIKDLDHNTDLEQVQLLSLLSGEEIKQIKNLDSEIAKLKSRDIPSQKRKLGQNVEDLNKLIDKLRDIENALSNKNTSQIYDSINDNITKKTIAQKYSIDQFKSYSAQAGKPIWYDFISSAKKLAESELHIERYPHEGDRCLLCQQELSPEARELILKLWDTIESDAQDQLDKSKKNLLKTKEDLSLIDLDFFNADSIFYRTIQNIKPELIAKIGEFFASARQKLKDVLKCLNETSTLPLSALSNSVVAEVENIVKDLQNQIGILEKEDPSIKIIKLESQLVELKHRQQLNAILPQIEDFVKKQIWARNAGKIKLNTRHITLKHNELFSQLVTDRYLQLFQKILKDLNCPLQVTVKTSSRKGETFKQIAFLADPSVPEQTARPQKVLSEGEKRAVALTDFLTEVALDTSSNAIILDDPVTSLDMQWRELVAAYLVKASSNRQVIIFTHDLPFLYYLNKYAKEEKVEMQTHWIKRGDHDDKPGYVFLNNSPALERDYRNPVKAREIYNRALSESAETQEALLHQGFSALRTSYEAFIIFELFQEVVLRFEERVSVGRLKDIVWDVVIAKEVMENYERLSRYIEGHLHSDGFLGNKPNCKMLNEEIEKFDILKKKLKDLRKLA